LEDVWGFEVTVRVLGLQLGYTKLRCFLCEWSFRARKHYYVHPKTVAYTRIAYSRREKCSKPPLINPENFHLPTLHMKLRLIKNFAKAMDQNSAGYMYCKNKFLRISNAKIKEGEFVGPQIRVNTGRKI
jgi:hypothetical protein